MLLLGHHEGGGAGDPLSRSVRGRLSAARYAFCEFVVATIVFLRAAGNATRDDEEGEQAFDH